MLDILLKLRALKTERLREGRRETERDTERETHTHRDTERDTHRETERERDRERHTHTDTAKEREKTERSNFEQECLDGNAGRFSEDEIYTMLVTRQSKIWSRSDQNMSSVPPTRPAGTVAARPNLSLCLVRRGCE